MSWSLWQSTGSWSQLEANLWEKLVMLAVEKGADRGCSVLQGRHPRAYSLGEKLGDQNARDGFS
jgi:hypothetical protein